jgi:hypothetical protein
LKSIVVLLAILKADMVIEATADQASLRRKNLYKQPAAVIIYTAESRNRMKKAGGLKSFSPAADVSLQARQHTI